MTSPGFTYDGTSEGMRARRERASFNAFVRRELSPEIATLAERVADLLGPVALPALDTLLRETWNEARDGLG